MFGEFEKLLKQKIGLDTASIGASTIERAVQRRLTACGVEDAHAYWKHINTSETELQALIEAVIVPETWFFRDREAFVSMARIANEEWLPAHPESTLRLLSLPCSTGEEPYSMAMALLDSRFPARHFRVDAVDISTLNLAFAQRAAYGKNSFRGNVLDFRDRHFEAGDHGYQLADAVSAQVHFQHGNLFDDGFLPGAEIYDIVFCRNMLIYFDRAAQDATIRLLTRLLTARGVLFVAPSETGVLWNHDFASTKEPLAFAFRKTSGAIPAPTAPELQVARPVKHLASHRKIASPVSSIKPQQAPRTVSQVCLEEVQRLADRGCLTEAAQSCEQYLRERGPSAQVFYLFGLIRDAGGDYKDAAAFYRKALYLDPQHNDVLMHLALLLEKQGDAAGAQLLQQRLRRLEQRCGK